MKALSKRLARLEAVTVEGLRPALVLLHGVGFDAESLVGVDGLEDHPRLEGESAGDYIARLEAHLRATRRRALPLVSFARYPGDDAPDAPQIPDAAMLARSTVAIDCS